MKQSVQGSRNESPENNPAEPNQSGQMDQAPSEMHERKHLTLPQMEMLGTGVATGVVASIIVQTGRSVGSKLLKNPVFLFGMGLTAGFFLRKYRKEIISTAGSAAVHGRDFAVRQKEKIKEILSDDIDAAD